MSVFDPVRLIGGLSEPLFPVRFLIGIIAFKPHDGAVSLKGKDVRGNAIEKPAIVTDDDGASSEML